MIRLITKMDGETIMNKRAKEGVTLDEICEIAECEFYGGYADYVAVLVDGRTYMELEG